MRMLTFYYHPLSPIARRVWLCLLEKNLEFEGRVVQLHLKEQLQPEFLELNPFHHVPVLVDGNVKMIESIAILDYLDARYPTPKMTPDDPVELGKMRMVQMIILNELMSVFPALMESNGVLPPEHPKAKILTTALEFLQEQLGEGHYFGGDRLNLADCVAGITLPLWRRIGVEFAAYPRLEEWMERLYTRSSWQQTEPSEEAFGQWRRFAQAMVQRAMR
jgi:glutathione S-transferase